MNMDNSVSEAKGKVDKDRDKDSLCSQWKTITKEFCQQTSCHGCSYIVDPTKPIVLRVWWGLMVSLFVCGLVAFLIQYTLTAMTYPFKTNIQVQNQPELPFPAVTVCNINQFDVSRPGVPNDTADLLLALSRFGPLLGAKGRVNVSAEAYATTKQIPIDTFVNMTWNKDSFLLHCSWSMYTYAPCTAYLREVDTYHGRCLQFNGDPTRRLFSDGSGIKQGLTMILDVNRPGYSQAELFSAGVLVSIHEPGDFADMISNVFLAMPGTQTLFGLQRKPFEFLASPFVAFGDQICMNPSDPDFPAPLNSYGTYSYSACLADCVSRQLLARCRCKTNIEANNTEYPWCTLEQYVVCYQPSAHLMFTQLSKTSNCSCPKPCSATKYDVTQSHAAYVSPSGQVFLENLLGVTSDRQDLLQLNFYFTDLLVETKAFTPEYTLATLASIFGGQMGFFLGVSCLTVLELLVLLISLCVAGVKWHWAKVKAKLLRHRVIPLQKRVEKGMSSDKQYTFQGEYGWVL